MNGPWDEIDVSTSIYRRAVPLDVDNPDTWFAVRVVHVESGIAVTVSDPSQFGGRLKAVTEIKQRLAAAGLGQPQ